MRPAPTWGCRTLPPCPTLKVRLPLRVRPRVQTSHPQGLRTAHPESCLRRPCNGSRVRRFERRPGGYCTHTQRGGLLESPGDWQERPLPGSPRSGLTAHVRRFRSLGRLLAGAPARALSCGDRLGEPLGLMVRDRDPAKGAVWGHERWAWVGTGSGEGRDPHVAGASRRSPYHRRESS